MFFCERRKRLRDYFCKKAKIIVEILVFLQTDNSFSDLKESNE